MHHTTIVLSDIMQVLVFLVSLYQIGISLAGFRRLDKSPARHAPQRTFALLVAAHNEEKVIAPLLDNLQGLDYPRELYEVFVICDNCSDRTADIVAAHSVQALVRTDLSRRGKGFAMEWALERLWERDRQYDAICVFDADNLVSRNYLREMNDKLLDGHQVIQGYVETKNPYDSWVSISYAITYWFINRLWQQARHNWGMASTLAGTGMCFEAGLLREMGWNAYSLTEDVEFTARCIEIGIHPTWASNAIVYDEKPVTLVGSIRQRLRWMRGHTDCARRYMKPMMLKALHSGSFSQIDAVIYLFQPIRFFFVAAVWVLTYLQLATPLYRQFSLMKLLPDWSWYALNTAIFLQIPLVMLIEKKPWKAYLGLIVFPIFQFTWFPITLVALFTSRNKTWSHTIHTRSMRIEDITGS